MRPGRHNRALGIALLVIVLVALIIGALLFVGWLHIAHRIAILGLLHLGAGSWS